MLTAFENSKYMYKLLAKLAFWNSSGDESFVFFFLLHWQPNCRSSQTSLHVGLLFWTVLTTTEAQTAVIVQMYVHKPAAFPVGCRKYIIAQIYI